METLERQQEEKEEEGNSTLASKGSKFMITDILNKANTTKAEETPQPCVFPWPLLYRDHPWHLHHPYLRFAGSDGTQPGSDVTNTGSHEDSDAEDNADTQQQGDAGKEK